MTWERVMYVSGPLRAPEDAVHGRYTPSVIKANTERALRYATLAWQAGWATICPHANTRDMDGIPGVPGDAFIAGDVSFLRRLRPKIDAITMLIGWGESSGARTEYQAASATGLILVEAERFEDEQAYFEYIKWLRTQNNGHHTQRPSP